MRHDRHFVDELTRKMGEGLGRLLPVDSISGSPDQPRRDVGQIADLVASIESHGVLEPLLVRHRTDGTYELVSGQRRLQAAITAGLTEVPCIELHVTDQVALEIALIENLQREDLLPFDEAEGLHTLSDKYHYSHEQIARAIGRSRVTVTETLKLLDIPPDLREECRHADVTAKGLLLEIAKGRTPGEMRLLLRAISERRLDRATLRDLRQQLAADQASGDDPAQPAAADPAARRPFTLRYRHPERRFSFALSFRAEAQPEPQEVIAALEELIQQIREDTSLGG